MNIKFLLKNLGLGLLIASVQRADALNCKEIESTLSGFEIEECVENENNEIIKFKTAGLLTEEVINNISTLDKLEDLNIYHDSYQDNFDLTPFESLENLKSFSIDCYRNPKHRYHGSEIKENSFKMKNLEKLYLYGCDVMGEDPLSNLTNLKELTIEIQRGQELLNLSHINNLKNLTSLYLDNYYSSTRRYIVTDFKGLNNLKILSIGPYYVNKDDIEEISTLESLEELYLINCRFDEGTDLNLLKNLKNTLKILNLSSNKLVEIPETIKELKNLKILNLSHNDIKEFPESLNELTNLEDINISYNENLVGKTLTNDNIKNCEYSNTKLCIAEETSCIKSTSNDLSICEPEPEPEPEPQNGCEEIDLFLKKNNIEMETSCYAINKEVAAISINEQIVTEEALDKILSYDTIEELIVDIDGSKKAIEKIGEKLLNIEYLVINSIKKNASLDLTPLKNLQYLSELSISSYKSKSLARITKNSLKDITHLEYLKLDSIKIYQRNLDDISKLTNLKTLIFGECHYPSSLDFSPLKTLQNLNNLEFDGYYKNKTPLYEIPSFVFKLTNLKQLTARNQKIDYIQSKISKLENLNVLDLSGNKIDSLPKALNNMASLRSVDFSNNPKMTGKTLTNENLVVCQYDASSSICKAKEMPCFNEDDNIKLCKNQKKN
ncbi:L domain-like protein [Piromyces finnis]|uniref:L domain-like protein n=1 Tax=Piromyces finnis TaxID=1754191 RepID=A0A1Y1VKQ0_9FUNG|nr:L domain-like protein [Piromyces finnis]|eukprot:ORX57947.1 L domain-like protein [Piromyces finnis]